MSTLTTVMDRVDHQPRDTDREGGLMGLAERGWLPDSVIRYGIRRLLKQRLDEEAARGDQSSVLRDKLSQGPIAVKTQDANRQH
ncbi:MAG: SAM-dependent methyltransferase, partial [Planctomycetota bacterium]